MFCNLDGTFTPTYGQVAELVDMNPNSVRRITRRLWELGALIRVADRPVINEGIARGGRIPVWSIPLAPSEARLEDPHSRPKAVPSAPKRAPTRASKGAPLRVEKLNPAGCSHPNPEDPDGYCYDCDTFEA